MDSFPARPTAPFDLRSPTGSLVFGRQGAAFTVDLNPAVLASSAFLKGDKGDTGSRGLTGPIGPIGLPGLIQSINGKSATDLVLTPDDIGASTAVKYGGQTFADPGIPTYHATLWGGVVANTGVDQAPNIRKALKAIPASGGRLLLPAGDIIIGSRIDVNGDRVSIEGASMYATHLITPASFATGDVFRFNGNYSGIRKVAFEHTQTSAQASSGELPFRTGSDGTPGDYGATVNLANGYGYVEEVSIRHNFLGVCMGTRGGWSRVTNSTIQYGADGVTCPGSGGILVENTAIGPENWIENVIITPNIGATPLHLPGFGVKITYSGATHLEGVDITQLRCSLAITPGNGQTVQSTVATNCYFDGCYGDNVVVQPTGSGWTFNTSFANCWITNINASGNGLRIGGGSPAGSGRPWPIMKVSWIGGVITSTAGQTGTGVLVADTLSADVHVSDTTICGWRYGANVAAGASHINLHDNKIGAYGFFDIPGGGLDQSSRTNYIGINVAAGSGDWITIHDNQMFGNANAPGSFAATGVNNRVHKNAGWNPIGPGNVTVTPSPMTIPASPFDVTYFGKDGSTSYVRDGSGTITYYTSAAQWSVFVPAGQSLLWGFTGSPTLTRLVH